MQLRVLSRAANGATGWRAILVVVVLALLGGLYAASTLQRQAGARADENAVLSARMVSALTAERNLDILDYGSTSRIRMNLNGDLAALALQGQAVELNIWTLNGHLLYADPRRPPNLTLLPVAEITLALAGPVVRATGESDRRGRRSIDVLLPVDRTDDGDAAPDMIVEVVLPVSSIQSTIARSSRELYSIAVVLSLLLGVALLRARRRRRSMRFAARHDALTGLGNRALLAERAVGLDRPGRDGWTALVLIDLDDFKDINDTLGHGVGDQLLVAVGRALRSSSRSVDVVTRLGGDEFAVLIDGLPTPNSATEAATHLLEALREPVLVAGLSLEVEASVGIALAPDHGTDLSALLRCADVAMYRAKQDGSVIATYRPEQAPGQAPHVTLLAELRRALGNAELRLYYQPKCATRGGIAAVEALVRWQHPERGLLAPLAFVPLAERTALIKPLTAWVLGEAARQCRAWQDAGLDLRIAVNISPRNLLDEDLPAVVLDAATAAGIGVSMLEIEITETAAMADPAKASAILNRLHSMDVRVAIDDFGAGYTSLSYLASLPVHCLKIDRQFITHLLDNRTDEAVVRHVINLAHDLGMQSLAEGVEDVAIWARLSDLGCDEIQGYVLTPPLPPEQFVRWLAGWRHDEDGSDRLPPTDRSPHSDRSQQSDRSPQAERPALPERPARLPLAPTPAG